MTYRVVVMVDGDTVSPVHASRILQEGAKCGAIALARVYGDLSDKSGWHDAKEFHAVDAGKGRSATALLMAIDAMEFALTDVFEAIVIASSDEAFVPLADRLSRYGNEVRGLGGADTAPELQAAFPSFGVLPN